VVDTVTQAARLQPAATDPSSWNAPPARFAGGLIAIAFVIMTGASADAEDDRLIDDPPVPANIATSDVIDLGANFNRNVLEMGHGGFGLTGTDASAPASPADAAGGDADPASIAKIRGIADERFARIDTFCGLTEQQRRKLRLAVELDTRRTAEAIDAVRRKYRGMRVNQQDAEWQKRFMEWQRDVESCRARLDLLCDADSLLMKALPSTLDAEQHARFVAEKDASLDCLWRAIVARVLVDFDDSLGLDEEQHEKLTSLLLAERPRLRVDGRSGCRVAQFAPQLVGLALTRIDDARLAQVVSPRQAKFLRQFANNGRAIRQHLESLRLLEKEP
jgi:hypothetical protein